MSYWMRMLRDADEDYRFKAVEAVGLFGEKALAALPDLIECFNPTYFGSGSLDPSELTIATSIVRIDPRHEYLLAQLRQKDYQKRREAAIRITGLGTFDPSFSVVRKAGADKWRLARDREAIPVLIEMLQDRQSVRGRDWIVYAELALDGLASFKHEAAAATSEVTHLLADKKVEIRRQAPEVLVAIGPVAKSTFPALRNGLKDVDAVVRANTAAALGLLGDRESIPALKEAMHDKDLGVRTGIVRGVAGLKTDADIVVLMLLDVMKEPVPPLRKVTVSDNYGRPLEATKEPDEEIGLKATAIESLGKLGPAAKAAVPVLIQAARDRRSPLADRFAPWHSNRLLLFGLVQFGKRC